MYDVIALPRIHIPFDFMVRNGIVGYGWPRSSDGTHRPPQSIMNSKKIKKFFI